MPPAPLRPRLIGFDFDVSQLFADAVAELRNTVAEGGGAFEVQVFGRGIHLGFQLVDKFFGDIGRFIGPANGRIGLAMGLDRFFDAGADVLLDRFGRDAVLRVVFLLQCAATFCFVHRIPHRVGDSVRVENHLRIDITCRTPDRLNQ